MNPDQSHFQHAEFLRLALPLMTRYQIPVTPDNYAVWYQYVLGENPALKHRIQELIDSGMSFTQELNQELFQRYASQCNVEKIDTIRSNLHGIIIDVNSTLTTAGNHTSRFDSSLNHFNQSLGNPNQLGDIKSLLTALLDETRQMQKRTTELQQHIESKSQEVEALQVELERERVRAKTDPMTGLVNRSALFDALARGVDESETRRGRLCLLMVDIDHFKRINDTHGHLVGDRVIKFVAESIRKAVKGKDTAARFGGEEFVLLLPDTPFEGALQLGRQLLDTIAGAKLMRADTKQPLGQITISLGLAVYKAGEEITDFIGRADKALYLAKNKGRNRICTEQMLEKL
jgi:diguanylate cyclase